MARFATKHTSTFESTTDEYAAGFSYPTDSYSYISKPGLSEQVVDYISHIKSEPDWMLQLRLKALQQFLAMDMPTWGADLSGINFNSFHYYLKPTDHQVSDWKDVPADVRATFDRLKIPEAERASLAGVKAQYDSEVVYGSLKDVYAKDGVVFLSMDDGLKQYPELVKQYFGKIIPSGDNKFAALNTAVWSGGSFVYVPKGVSVALPLQTYFRINSPNAGQFERTLIIVDEGASVHYIEGCFLAGTFIRTETGRTKIEDITDGSKVVSHSGRLCSVYNTQSRQYLGKLFTIQIRGNPNEIIQVTEEHPFLVVKRTRPNERNCQWEKRWQPIKECQKGDYACIPIDQRMDEKTERFFPMQIGQGRHGYHTESLCVQMTADLFTLIGYYLAEGSISSGHYLNFSFNISERELIEEVKRLVQTVFGETRISESHHEKNHGTNVVISSTRLCRFFEQFGKGSHHKNLPDWVLVESYEKQQALITSWFKGDGNYYRKTHKDGFKECFRICTTSEVLAQQGKLLLARLGVAVSLNVRDRKSEQRASMFTLVIGGEYMLPFGDWVGWPIQPRVWGKKRATHYYVDKQYLYCPIRSIRSEFVKDVTVYNFSVETDESYVAGGVAVHNCTAPTFSAGSLHSAVVEVVVLPGAQCQYTTVQNWYKNIYNLVTKRAYVHAEGKMIWTDFNMGSKVTMKYPGFVLAGKGAVGETLSMALAGVGQHQDTGSKAIHLAPYTSSTIISKSISKDGGRTSYRGLVQVNPQAKGSKNTVICDALLLDSRSRSDTYPTDRVLTNDVELQHEATVSKIGDDQLFYLMSRGISEEDARKMVVHGFVDGLIKKLPLEYAVEMNRLIDHEMEGSVG